MKTCAECDAIYPLDRLACLDCDEILDEALYLRIVWVTLAIAGIAHLLLARSGYDGGPLWKETLYTGTFLLAIVYPAWKIWQKLREPERAILREVGSVFADRGFRLLLLGVLLFVVYTASTLIGHSGSVASPPEDPTWLDVARRIRGGVLLVLAVVWPVAAMVDQGWAFFDPRIPDTYLAREATRFPSDAPADRDID